MIDMRKDNKISIAMIATNLKLNGISSVIMTYVKYLNLDKYKLTLIVGAGVNAEYRAICQDRGVEIIELAPRKESPIGFYKGLFKILILHHFDAVHVHGSNASIGLELLIARLVGIKIRIAHSHNTTSTSMRLHNLMKPIFNWAYTDAFACGDLAGKWLFGSKNFTFIPNGIKLENFRFNKSIRNNKRKELGVQSNLLVGHVGRFNFQKNHLFILRVFKEILKLRPDARLLLVGKGPDFQIIKKEILKLKLSDNIIIYGVANEMGALYMAMDTFLFPSRFEGFPVTLIEAQVAGLPCIVSNVISREVKISSSLVFHSLSESPKLWAQAVVNNVTEIPRDVFYEKNILKLNEFDEKNVVLKLEKQYDLIFERIQNAK